MPARPDAPAPRALSHHEIVSLAAPFVRAGHRIDLAASERAEGRLVFACDDAPPGSRYELKAHPGGLTLTRRLQPALGEDRVQGAAPLEAVAVAEGDDAADLLARLERLPPSAQWRRGPGWVAALHHRVAAAPDKPPRLEGASLSLSGWRLELAIPESEWASARLHLAQPDAGASRRRLPDDLLAVLGWAWSPLRQAVDGWRGSVRILGIGRSRERHALARLEEAGRHLARTLGEPPPAFHQRLRRERFAVLLRRSMPLLAWAMVAGLFLCAPWLRDAQVELGGLLPLALSAPLALLAAFLFGSESPRFEWPPWPRPPRAARW